MWALTNKASYLPFMKVRRYPSCLAVEGSKMVSLVISVQIS